MTINGDALTHSEDNRRDILLLRKSTWLIYIVGLIVGWRLIEPGCQRARQTRRRVAMDMMRRWTAHEYRMMGPKHLLEASRGHHLLSRG